jgi:uncharacterized RDD family membrane protein YckC
LYAGFWRRVAAYLIDSTLGGVAAALILLPFSFSEYGALIGVVVIIFFFGYFVVMHSSTWQATVGKRLLRVKVTNQEGHPISIGRSLGRLLGMFVSSLILGLGYPLAGVTERRQALHDIIAGTLVVRRDSTPAEIVAGGGPMPITAGVWGTLFVLGVLPFLFGLAASIVMPNLFG